MQPFTQSTHARCWIFESAEALATERAWLKRGDGVMNLQKLLQRIAESLHAFPCVVGIEALNEPWQFTPMDVLKAFYWDAYWAVRTAAWPRSAPPPRATAASRRRSRRSRGAAAPP